MIFLNFHCLEGIPHYFVLPERQSLIDHFCIKKVTRGGGGLVTGFSSIDYLRTGNHQQRSGVWLPAFPILITCILKPAAVQKW